MWKPLVILVIELYARIDIFKLFSLQKHYPKRIKTNPRARDALCFKE